MSQFKPLFDAYQAQGTAELWNIHVSDRVVSPSTRRTGDAATARCRAAGCLSEVVGDEFSVQRLQLARQALENCRKSGSRWNQNS